MERLKKNDKIRTSMKETFEKRKSQTCRVLKVKIQQDKLNSKQQEQLKMIFLEAKWIINDVINYSENPYQNIWEYPIQKDVRVLKNGVLETRKLNFISSQMKQSVVAEMISNIRTLSTLKKQGKKVGRLKYRSEVRELNLKQFGNTYKFKEKSKMKIQGVKGLVKVNGLDQFISRVKAKLICNSRTVVLNRFVPTTQFCFKCGNKTPHRQDRRSFVCSFCGETEDRDIHAAGNMILLGREVRKIVGVGRAELTPVDIGWFSRLSIMRVLED